MKIHTITGTDLLRYLGETPADAYPLGVADSTEGITLHGRTVQPTDEIVCWNISAPHRDPSAGLDTDWTVDFARA